MKVCRKTNWVLALMLTSCLIASAVSGAQIKNTEAKGPGYWKMHAEEVMALWDGSWLRFGNIVVGESPMNYLVTDDPMYIDSEHALLLLNGQCPYWMFKIACNGYVKLGGQLVAAELNILNGVDGRPIESVMARSLAIFAEMESATYYFLLDNESQQEIIDLAESLERFNSGI